MVRSSGISPSRALSGITHIISARTSATTISRPTGGVGTLGETTETTADHSEKLWLFPPGENAVQTSTGERITGDLGGLCVADGTVDLDHNDRLTYGGVEYEIDTIVGHPHDGDPDGTPSPETNFWVLTLVRRQ